MIYCVSYVHANTHPSPHIQCLLYVPSCVHAHGDIPTQAYAYSASCVHASNHSSLCTLCKLCVCTHPLKPAHTLQAVSMHPSTYHSSLRIGLLCKLCACIHPLKPRILCKLCTCMMHVHSGFLSGWMDDASTHSSIRILCKLCTFRTRMQICMQVCMRALHAKFACTCTGRDMRAHAENACRECCMYCRVCM